MKKLVFVTVRIGERLTGSAFATQDKLPASKSNMHRLRSSENCCFCLFGGGYDY